MKREISIRNGSGWNRYQALTDLKCLPRGTKGLMAKNGVSKIEIEPKDWDRPFGFVARFLGEAKAEDDGEYHIPETLFTLSFDQNTQAQTVRDAVMELLAEGIPAAVARRRREIEAERLAAERQAARDAERLAAAKAAGFANAEDYEAHLSLAAGRERAEAAAREAGFATVEEHRAHIDEESALACGFESGAEFRRWMAAGPVARAEMTFNALVAALRLFPAPTRLTRAGKLVRELSPNAVEEFGRRLQPDGIRAWLALHGHRGSIDERHVFFAAAKAAAAEASYHWILHYRTSEVASPTPEPLEDRLSFVTERKPAAEARAHRRVMRYLNAAEVAMLPLPVRAAGEIYGRAWAEGLRAQAENERAQAEAERAWLDYERACGEYERAAEAVRAGEEHSRPMTERLDSGDCARDEYERVWAEARRARDVARRAKDELERASDEADCARRGYACALAECASEMEAWHLRVCLADCPWGGETPGQ